MSIKKRSKWHSVPVSTKRILEMIESAEPDIKDAGMIWYSSASDMAKTLAKKGDITFRQSCGILASLSPGTRWERNIEEARAMILGKDTKFTTYPKNVDKAYRILNGEDPATVLGGRKVTAFYSLFMDPEDPDTVVVDRHAVRICCTYPFASDNEAQQFLRIAYDRCADAYRKAAKKLWILPHQAQAIAWENFRSIPIGERRWTS